MCLLQMTEVAGGPGSGGIPTTASIVKEGWLFKRGEFHRHIVSVSANAACSLGESEKSQRNLLYNYYYQLGYGLRQGMGFDSQQGQRHPYIQHPDQLLGLLSHVSSRYRGPCPPYKAAGARS
jgi:hypothetical protein